MNHQHPSDDVTSSSVAQEKHTDDTKSTATKTRNPRPQVIWTPLMPLLQVNRSESSTSWFHRRRHDPTSRDVASLRATNSFIRQLDTFQTLLCECLGVPSLSSVLEYDQAALINVNAVAWWHELQRIASCKPNEWWIEALERVFHCFDRINRMQEPEHNRQMTQLGEYVNEAKKELLQAVQYAGSHLVLDRFTDRNDRVGIELINMLLQHQIIGSYHAFHNHRLIASLAHRVTPTSSHWVCTMCNRESTNENVIYRCAACDFNLCHECFTRIPNEITRKSQAPSRKLHLDQWFSTILPPLTTFEHFSTLARDLMVAVRQRVYELPSHRSLEWIPLVEIALDLMRARGFMTALVRNRQAQWVPDQLVALKFRHETFLGVLFASSSISSLVDRIDLTANGKFSRPPRYLTMAWKDGYDRLCRLYHTIMETLLRDDQNPVVISSTLYWLSTLVAASMGQPKPETEDFALDGLLINVTTAIAHVATKFMQTKEINPLYHFGSTPRRAFGYAHESRLHLLSEREHQELCDEREEARLRAQETSQSPAQFYHSLPNHVGIGCDHCNTLDFDGVRYKCVNCPDCDFCGVCFEQFVHQSNDSMHPMDHVFFRLPFVVPFLPLKLFEPMAPITPKNEIHQADRVLHCGDCEVVFDKNDPVFRCANCLDPRIVCRMCLEKEERHEDLTVNPWQLHAAGHVYFVLLPAWRQTHSVWSSALHCHRLFPPPMMLPRECFDTATEVFYVTIKSLHVGPLQTLAKLIAVVKEMTELQAFLTLEDEKTEQTLQRSKAYNASKLRLQKLRGVRIMMELHAVTASTVATWLRFYGHACRWLLKQASSNGQNALEKVVVEFTPEFRMFPEHFFFDVCDLVHLLTLEAIQYEAICEIVTIEDVEALLVLFFQLMASSECTKNPHLRIHALKAVVAMISFLTNGWIQKPTTDSVLMQVWTQNPLLLYHAVEILVHFHDEMEAYHKRNEGLVFSTNGSGGDAMLWGFVSIRSSVALVLRLLWHIPAQRPHLVRMFSPPAISTVRFSTTGNHVNRLLNGLWSDGCKLLEEALGRISTVQQLMAIQDAGVELPFRPAIMDRYVAVHAKHLRITMRSLIEILEIVNWMAANEPLKKTLLKPELIELGARTISFCLHTLANAHETKAWEFSPPLMDEAAFLAAHLMVLVVYCGRNDDDLDQQRVWELIHKSTGVLIKRIGDLEVGDRCKLSQLSIEMERTVETSTSMDSTHGLETMAAQDDELDEHQALALLEKQTACSPVDSSALWTASNLPKAPRRSVTKRFIASFASDGRFEHKRFQNVATTMLSHESSWSTWLERFANVLQQCEGTRTLQSSMDELLGEIPDAYMDPLVHTIMLDPVRLPSGQIVDRAVLERHVLSSSAQSLDPFTREPFEMERIESCEALRKEIQLFLRTKLKQTTAQDDVLATWGIGWDCLFETHEW